LGITNTDMRNPYPTAEDILNAPVSFRPQTILVITTWKEQRYKGWRDKGIDEKWEGISDLIYRLSMVYRDKRGIPKLEKDAYSRCARSETESTIYLDPAKISIVTALHEFAHHLYGDSEFKACRWSIWLFKTCFPLEFKTLDFRGHLLIKRV